MNPLSLSSTGPQCKQPVLNDARLHVRRKLLRLWRGPPLLGLVGLRWSGSPSYDPRMAPTVKSSILLYRSKTVTVGNAEDSLYICAGIA